MRLRIALAPTLARHVAVDLAFFSADAYFQSLSTRKRRMKTSPYSSSSPPCAMYAALSCLIMSSCLGVSSSSATWLAATGPTSAAGMRSSGGATTTAGPRATAAAGLASSAGSSSSGSASAVGSFSMSARLSSSTARTSSGVGGACDSTASRSVSSLTRASSSATCCRRSLSWARAWANSRFVALTESVSPSCHGSMRRSFSQMLPSSYTVTSVAPMSISSRSSSLSGTGGVAATAVPGSSRAAAPCCSVRRESS
mmetsp:Transcript_835/g.2263  ORF Transcript_835/g.2263 Transcript_835/m.2263 type:complete len:255 (+) Transcript_835:1322-2086(+)